MGFTEGELKDLLSHMGANRLMAAAGELALDGILLPDLINGELTFKSYEKETQLQTNEPKGSSGVK